MTAPNDCHAPAVASGTNGVRYFVFVLLSERFTHVATRSRGISGSELAYAGLDQVPTSFF